MIPTLDYSRTRIRKADVPLEYRWGADGDIQYVIAIPPAYEPLADDVPLAIDLRQRSVAKLKEQWRQLSAGTVSEAAV